MSQVRVLLISAALVLAAAPLRAEAPAVFAVGFGQADITPHLAGKPVYMAGFGQNRKAVGVHDPLSVRAVVLVEGKTKLAIACADVIGIFNPVVRRVRGRLPGFAYVLVSSTHNHEGPDTMGLWGPNPFTSGVDPAYLQRLEDAVVAAIEQADARRVPATAVIGTARAPELLVDNREPYVKHDQLAILRFVQPGTDTTLGLLVQWHCHPETLDSRNIQISTDFVGPAVTALSARYKCPVVYVTGTVGGLMTSLGVPIQGPDGKALDDGTFTKTEAYGRALAAVAEKALDRAVALSLTPMRIRQRDVYLPLDNRLYQVARQLGVFDRQAYRWSGDTTAAEPAKAGTSGRLCLRTEIAWLRLGDLDIAAIPGEIYPELVLGKVQDPPDPGADFPDARIEPAIFPRLKGPYRILIGLANDEIGYIIPKRQWDAKAPFCYGRTKPQYGEVNSVGPETAPIVCEAFQSMTEGARTGEEK